jgi:TolB-like protein/Flp pilus assembly protein TadD
VTPILSRFFSQLISEVRRREIVSVVITYAVVGWLVLQVAELTFEPLGLPKGGVRLLIIISISGFPAVVFLGWILDIKSHGVMFDLPLWQVEGAVTQKQKKASRPLALFLCLLVILVTWGFAIFLNDRIQPAATETASLESESESKNDVNITDFPANSIAVLAFENFDGQPESNYFADGLAEEILNHLSSIRELNVAARSSSFRFRGERVDIREVAQLLNVGHVLEGSVRREGNRIRISAQLIDGKEGFNAWSKSYDRNLDDVFAIQKEIASSVVNELKIALSVDSQNRLQQTQSENIDAYIFYLQGLEKLRSSQDAERIGTANKLFNQALSVDSSFSRAYAGICEANLALYVITNGIDDFTNAEVACEKAQNLNLDSNSDVKVALSRLYRVSGSYQKAQEILLEAIAISPNDVDAYIELGEVYSAKEEFDEAEIAFLRAIDLKRNYWKAYEALANFYYTKKQYNNSANTYEIVSRLTPDSSKGFLGKGSAYWMLGDTKKALQAYERSLELNPSRQAYTNLGMFYYYAAQFEQAVDMQTKALGFAKTDHRIWGRLAESYRFIPGQESESQYAYKRAAELARDNLQVNKEDWHTRAILGLYLVHLDNQAEGMKLLEQAIEQSRRNPEILYFKALALLQEDDTERAVSLLQEAVTLEQNYQQFIVLDPDLKRLQNDPRFMSLMPNSSL